MLTVEFAGVKRKPSKSMLHREMAPLESRLRPERPPSTVLLLELVLLLMICAVALGWLARHFKFPYPIALVVGGALLGMIPNLPQFPFDPQLILVVVLPPILYQAALLTSWYRLRDRFLYDDAGAPCPVQRTARREAPTPAEIHARHAALWIGPEAARLAADIQDYVRSAPDWHHALRNDAGASLASRLQAPDAWRAD